MTRPFCLAVLLLCALYTSAAAKSVTQTGTQDRFQLWDFDSPREPSNSGVFSTANSGTTFFGGTYWAADSMRWEALPDSVWTFDTGVGSAIVQHQVLPANGQDLVR